MPLESPTEAAGALFQVPRYHPSSPEQIDLLSLPRGSEQVPVGLELIKQKWNLFMNWNTELLNQFYGWLEPSLIPKTSMDTIFLGIGAFSLALLAFAIFWKK